MILNCAYVNPVFIWHTHYCQSTLVLPSTFWPSIHLIQMAAGIKCNDLFPFTGSHQRASGNVISGLKRDGGIEDSNRGTHSHRHTQMHSGKGNMQLNCTRAGVSPHGNHVFENIKELSNSRQHLRAVSNGVWVEEQTWSLLFPNTTP